MARITLQKNEQIITSLDAETLGIALPQNTHGTQSFTDAKEQIHDIDKTIDLYICLGGRFNQVHKSMVKHISDLEKIASSGAITAQNVHLHKGAFQQLTDKLKIAEDLWGTQYNLAVGGVTSLTTAATAVTGYLMITEFQALEVSTIGWGAAFAVASALTIRAARYFKSEKKSDKLSGKSRTDEGKYLIYQKFKEQEQDLIEALNLATKYNLQIHQELKSPKPINSDNLPESAKILRNVDNAEDFISRNSNLLFNNMQKLYHTTPPGY